MITERKKILIACDSAKSLIDFRGKLIKELCKCHDVYVFTPAIPGHLKSKFDSLSVTAIENELNGSNISIFADLKYMLALNKVIRSVKPDVFFPYTMKPIVFGTLVARINNVEKITPLISGLGHSFNAEKKGSLLNKFVKLLLRFTLKNRVGLFIIFQNRDDHKTLLKMNVMTPAHSVYVVNGSGVDLDYYSYCAPDLSDVSFLMVSRLINAKGLSEYFEAAKIVQISYPYITFELIGAYVKNIDAISRELFEAIKSGKVITYLGEANDVRPYLNNASVVVLPSYYGEGIPRCLLEAMAVGRPIITCDSVGCRETINTGDHPNGFLVSPKNVTELVDKMEFYIKNSDAILNHGLNGLALARHRFDVNLVNDQMKTAMGLL